MARELDITELTEIVIIQSAEIELLKEVNEDLLARVAILEAL